MNQLKRYELDEDADGAFLREKQDGGLVLGSDYDALHNRVTQLYGALESLFNRVCISAPQIVESDPDAAAVWRQALVEGEKHG